MKILVTGGTGFVGSHIVEYLVQRGDNVTILDNLNTGKIENLSKVKTNINFVNGDIRDYKLLESLVNDSDGVFHEAALASVHSKKHLKYFVAESQTPGGLNWQGVNELRKSGYFKSLEKSINNILKRLNKV